MFVVYWTVFEVPEQYQEAGIEFPGPRFQSFDQDKMSDALKLTEELRKKQRAGEPIGYVTFCSENPNSVGHPGADDVKPGYDWKKRRE